MTPPTRADEQLMTDEQVENWRKVLLFILGPYARLMTREQIQAYRDLMQAIALSKDKGKGDE